MAVATYTTNLTDIYTSDSETTASGGWTAIGTGGAGLTIPETDYYIQGTACATKGAFANATKGFIRTNSDVGGSGTDGAYIAWMTHTAPNSLAVKASGGMQFLIGSASGVYHHHYVGGSDTMTFQGWVFVAVKEQGGYQNTSTGTPSTTVESSFGGLWNLPSGGPTKGSPCAMDGIRVGRCDAVIEFGTGADPEATFASALATFDSSTNRYGNLTQRVSGGTIENSGLIQFGTATNAVEFTGSDQNIVIRAHDHVTAGFNAWEANNASSIISFTRINVSALGGNSIGSWTTNNNATLNWDSCSFSDMGTFAFGTNSTINQTTFLRCGVITHAGATMNNSKVLLSTAALNTGALSYNIAADPDGEMDNMTFSKGTAAHHAIDFGTNVDSALGSITLTGCEFTGFGSTADSNDSTVRFLASSGALTLNLVGCTVDGVAATTSNFSVHDTAGMTVTVAISVPVKITVVDTNNIAIEYVQTSIHLNADDSEVLNTDTNVSGIASGSFGGTTPSSCYIRARKSTPDSSAQVAVVAGGGTGYTVDDILTVTGGTGTAANLKVTAVSGGVITAVVVSYGGVYTATPGNPASVTGGTGSSATFTITYHSGTRYKPFSTSGTIAATTGLDTTVVLQEDTIVT